MNRIALYSRPHPNVSSWFDMVDESAKRGMTVLEAFTNMDRKQREEMMAEIARKELGLVDPGEYVFDIIS